MSQPRPNSKQDKSKIIPNKTEEDEARAIELKKAVRSSQFLQMFVAFDFPQNKNPCLIWLGWGKGEERGFVWLSRLP